MTEQRILRGSTDPVCRVSLLDQDGEPTGGFSSVTATVRDLDGQTVGTAQRTATETAGEDTPGDWTVPLTSDEASSLTNYVVSWYVDTTRLVATTRVAIVSGFLFSIAELRRWNGMNQIDGHDLLDARDWISALVERETGAAWCQRAHRDTWGYAESDRRTLEFRPVIEIVSATTNGQSTTPTLVDAESGLVDGDFYSYQCVIDYTAGVLDVPQDLKEAAMVAAQDRILRRKSGISDRARSQSNDLGITIQFSYPGPGHPTGLDFVDEALLAHDLRLPAF